MTNIDRTRHPMWDWPTEKLHELADSETPKPEEGTWILTSPSGREFIGNRPMAALREEINNRVPPSVALARIILMTREPDDAKE